MRRRVVLGTAALLLVAFCVTSWALFLRPWTADLSNGVDAVVVLAGGGPRIDGGVSLMQEGVAPLLILSDGAEERWEEVEELCNAEHDYELDCFTPDPANTVGEARAVAFTAELRDLDSLVLVTTRTHARRAQLRFDRCTDARVQVMTVDQELSPFGTVVAVLHEWAGMAEAVVLERHC